MIFEKQDYQQDCLENISKILQNFDFKAQNVQNLQICFQNFYAQNPMPIIALSNKLNIDILMETGTGKTFTYLNLIFELHKQFKQNKFIIFVPRKAILESVKQNIRLTKDYFYNQYKHHLKIYTYEGSKSQSAIINHYIKNTDELSVLILTNSAIDKKDNILNKTSESLFDTKSIFENIAALNPISIIDEPHLLKGEAFNAYFSKISALYFRFGATFPKEKDFELSNVAYCLDSISAFRKYLVKQIRVHTISKDSQAPFLLSVNGKSAKLSFLKAGIEKHDTFIKGVDLGRLDSSLSGVSIVKIAKDKAYLSNGETLQKAKSYKLEKSEINILLEKAIDLHFEKEAILFSQNIKALSLFFIPNIEDFREIEGKDEPFIKNEFERLYKQKRKEILNNPHLPQNYKDYLAKDFDESGNLRVHQGYFSGDSQVSTKKKENTKENIEANDIKMILGQKEKLLSFDTPLRFIFSVWALQEGWDNPNIFTLTKLANSNSDTSRHQQVGRGLRICVNSDGKRITHRYLNSNDNAFFDINYLDMLISGEELGFIEGLQREIMDSSFVFGGDFIDGNVLNEMIENRAKSDDFIYLLRKRLKVIEYNEENNTYKIISPIYEAIKDNEEAKEILGDDFKGVLERFKESNNKHDQLINANKSQEKVKIRKELAKDFKELWRTINAKAQLTYHNIQKQALIDSICLKFNEATIEKESITYERKIYDAKQNKIIIADSTTLKDRDYKKALQKELTALLLDFAKDSHLPLQLICGIYNALPHKNFYNSPKKAFATLKNIITDSLHENLLSCVSYEFCQNAFSNTTFTFAENDPLYTSKGEPKDEIYKHKLGKYESKDKKPSDKYLYDKAIWDSTIEEEVILEEHQNVEGKSIEVFAKLPKFSIPTPFKAYQPDFAYLLKDEKGQKIFFVCETKGYDKESDIPPQEQQKIDYAKRFFESLQRNLKNTQVIFTTRIKAQELRDIIKSTLKG
ncbi:DEAD/DEAH box helicase family protein [Campylobacter sp. MIT 21-1685]|uniref:restriction endonuclease n=1 Tax=unclassified Campylobacter TaxID=2593542 RepID=UPI00224A7460|nr:MULTISPECIES: DEAD/DEAH box helicase family protein [unclassified Campylobacter]MCX2683446.1 DEAD/DEAH box helicase family protein [Campylobacter sp. MIT 21-1684]MCX2751732.1 DEAD/DEAH box helicase family protein [Campylobacter sp. MIT 21-1682]MCX2807934.1 DEAD/DEAH box helicase family protein [Campylobacter sp. MIT 21-1685]